MNQAGQEIWKGVSGCEDLYEISNHGRLKRLKDIPPGRGYNRIRKAGMVEFRDDRGYWFTCIPKRGAIAVHRLVAEAFCEGKAPGKEVNHIDGNRKNNKASNLEYVTHRENMQHAWATGLIRKRGVSYLEIVKEVVTSLPEEQEDPDAWLDNFGNLRA